MFLIAVMRSGIGLVRGQVRKSEHWTLSIERGPKEMRGVKMIVNDPITVGRSSGADIVINAGYVSGRHTRFSTLNDALIVEDLGSTNGTYLEGALIHEPTRAEPGDLVQIGDVSIRIGRS
jgi:pSer/pThr/pTyr-binding forkhead associated (FHA) protein